MPKPREYTGNTLLVHSQSHSRDEIVKEEAKIRKIEKRAKEFRGRAQKGPQDLKRHDQVRQDERQTMWNAYTELGWGFRKIGNVFTRDWRTVKKAVETYEPRKRETADSAEKARAMIGKCRLEVASYSPVNLLQNWLDKADEDATTCYYTNEDIEMLYSEARGHHAGPLRPTRIFLPAQKDPTFGPLRQKFPDPDLWTAHRAWVEQMIPYSQAFYSLLRKVESIVAHAFDTFASEMEEKGIKEVDWIDGVGFTGFVRKYKVGRLLTVLAICDLLVYGVAGLPSKPYWARLSNSLQQLRLRMNLGLSEVTGVTPKGGWPSGIVEARALSSDRPLEFTRELLDKLGKLQLAEDLLMKALKELESKI